MLERAMQLLEHIDSASPELGTPVTIRNRSEETDGAVSASTERWLAASWSTSTDELHYLVSIVLVEGLGALNDESNMVETAVSLAPRGYELLEQRRTQQGTSAMGFCAMWFSEEVSPLWAEVISPAISACGYEPVRMDTHEHVNRIDDEIIAMIRRSRFVVADFTGHRGGVYFEAGFALGLDRPVIWMCREDALKDAHFDTRQYNFIVWKQGEYEAARKRLQDRIGAVLGRGPRGELAP